VPRVPELFAQGDADDALSRSTEQVGAAS